MGPLWDTHLAYKKRPLLRPPPMKYFNERGWFDISQLNLSGYLFYLGSRFYLGFTLRVQARCVYNLSGSGIDFSKKRAFPPKYHFKWLWIGWRKLKWKLKWSVQYPFNVLSKIVQEATMQWSKKRCKGKGAPARWAIRTSRCKLEKYRSAHLFYRNKRWMGRCECHQRKSNHSAPINDRIILELSTVRVL